MGTFRRIIALVCWQLQAAAATNAPCSSPDREHRSEPAARCMPPSVPPLVSTESRHLIPDDTTSFFTKTAIGSTMNDPRLPGRPCQQQPTHSVSAPGSTWQGAGTHLADAASSTWLEIATTNMPHTARRMLLQALLLAAANHGAEASLEAVTQLFFPPERPTCTPQPHQQQNAAGVGGHGGSLRQQHPQHPLLACCLAACGTAAPETKPSHSQALVGQVGGCSLSCHSLGSLALMHFGER